MNKLSSLIAIMLLLTGCQYSEQPGVSADESERPTPTLLRKQYNATLGDGLSKVLSENPGIVQSVVGIIEPDREKLIDELNQVKVVIRDLVYQDRSKNTSVWRFSSPQKKPFALVEWTSTTGVVKSIDIEFFHVILSKQVDGSEVKECHVSYKLQLANEYGSSITLTLDQVLRLHATPSPPARGEVSLFP